MDDLRYGPGEREAPRQRWTRRWRRQVALAILLAVLVMGGQPAAASYATGSQPGVAGVAGRVASVARSIVTPGPRAEAATVAVVRDTVAPATDSRPDFQVAFTHVDDAQAGRSFSYTVQVRNDGTASGAVTVSTVLPPELANVRVTAPGFICTRRFSASGAQAGTLVTCARNELESGGAAEILIEANAPASLGSVHLTATASTRDDLPDADDTNNDADTTVQIHS
jgi:uncharacterized repeat protein (TIGR01451 family)